MEKNKKIYMMFLIIFLIALVASISFAFFRYVRTGSNVNKIQMGNIEFALLDGEEVYIYNAFPQADLDGNLNDAYSFVVKNNSSDGTDIMYSIKFFTNNIDNSKHYFTNEQIKYNLTKDGVYYNNTSSSNGRLLSTINGFDFNKSDGDGIVLKDEVISAGAEVVYNLRLWIDDSLDYSKDGYDENGLMVGSYNNYVYSLKVGISAVNK